jgi:hypothetical protein
VLSVLPHELGHALAALGLGAPAARVEVGSPRGRIRGRIGRLRFAISPISSTRWLWFGVTTIELEGGTPGRRAVGLATGPLVSAILAIVFGYLGSVSGTFLAAASYTLAVSHASTFAQTALPIRYGKWFSPYAGMSSDGMKILELVRRSAQVAGTKGQV